MKCFKLTALLGILILALWAPAASASTVILDASITSISLTKSARNITLTNASSSSVAVNGQAYYLPDLTGTETYSYTTPGSTGPSYNYSSGTFLTKLDGSISGTTLITSLNGLAPFDQGLAKPGYITETVTDTAFYTGTWPTGSAATSFSIPYTYSYALTNNSLPHYFYSLNYTVTAVLYCDGIKIGSTNTLFSLSENNANKSPLANIPLTNGSGTLTTPTFKPSPNSGTHTFEVVLTATESGYTAPPPASILLLGSGLLGVGLFRFRRREKKIM